MPKKGIFRTRLIGYKTYAKRNPDGTFVDIQSVKRAIIQNIRQRAKTHVKSGYGFRGDTIKRK